MKITVLGAGAIGSAIAHELAARDDVDHVQICDARARSLQELHERVESPKLRSFQVDLRDPHVLTPILHGSQCVVASVPPELYLDLAELCLALGIHFCDLGGNDQVVQQELALAERARERSVWIVPNCGLAPGLANVLCLLGVEQFDRVEAAHVRVGDVPLYPEPPFNFRVSWSAEKIIEDYTNPVLLIEEGVLKTYPSLSYCETIRFEEPFGEMEAFCTQGGLATLAQDLVGRVQTLDHKTIRWPGHAQQMQFLLGLGFGEKRSIDVRTHLTYRDVLTRRMRQRLGGEHEDAVLLRVLVQGTRAGAERTLVYEMVDRYQGARHATAMRRCTSIPTATVAVLVASGQVPGGGAAPPEYIVPRAAFCEALLARGLPITTAWYEGHVPVTALPDQAPTAEP